MDDYLTMPIKIPHTCNTITLPCMFKATFTRMMVTGRFEIVKTKILTDVDIHPYVGLHGGSDGKESACNGRDLGPIPGLERSPWKGNGDPTLQ